MTPRKRTLILLGVGLLVAGAAAGLLVLRFQRRVELAGSGAPAWFPAPWQASPPYARPGAVAFWLTNRPVRAAADFNGQRVYGGEMGLLAAGGGGAFRRLTAVDGLPVDRVTALAESGGRLVVGTGGGGLARWDGRRFERLALPVLAADWITDLVSLESGELLATTRSGRLLALRGEEFRFVEAAGLPKDGLTAVAEIPQGLLVGTLRHGLYRLSGGRAQAVGQSKAAFRMVTALAALPGGGVLAGTDNGLLLLSASGEPQGLLFPGRPVEYAGVAGDQVLCACVQDGLYAASVPDFEAGRRAFRHVMTPGVIHGARAGGGLIELLTGRGVYRLTESAGASPRLDLAPVELPAGELPSGSVMALAGAGRGGVWLGYFDGGVERRTPDGAVAQAVAAPGLRGVNCLAPDGGGLWIGTPQGLWRWGALGLQPAGATESPLRAGYVNQVLPGEPGTPAAVAHGTGLSLLQGGREELLYALQGLPSNKVYCAARRGGALYVGTLGGLAVLRGGNVAAVWQADNSPLRSNWITALLPCEAGLVVATYGGGVHLLGDDGAWRPFAGVDPQLSVNPNALCLLGDQVLAGTLDQGLWRLDPSTLRGAAVPAPLPSRCVQSIVAAGGALFVATDNGVARLALPAPSLKLESSS